MAYWKEENNALVGFFEFKNFSVAFGFMTQVALLAEKINHHPDWRNCWDKVEIRLTTHDKGNIITQKDLDLAEGISNIYSTFHN